jgi:hypothetical protein
MAPRPPHHPPLTLNLRCARCSYPLRGLDPDGACPECGVGIPDSLDANHRRCARVLRRAVRMHVSLAERTNPRWRRTLCAALVSLALVQVALVAWYVAWVPDRSYDRAKLPDFQLLFIAGWYAVCVWLLASRAPVSPGRLWLRVLACAPPLAAGLALASELVAYPQHALFAAMARAPTLLVPALVFLTFDRVARVAACGRGRRTVVAFRVIGVVMALFLGVKVLVGLLEARRVAQTTAAALESLAGRGGMGLACLLAVSALMLHLAWRLWIGSPGRPDRGLVPACEM